MALSIITNLASHQINLNDAVNQFENLKNNLRGKEQLFQSTLKVTLGVDHADIDQTIFDKFNSEIKTLKGNEQTKISQLVDDLFREIVGLSIVADPPSSKLNPSDPLSTISKLRQTQSDQDQALIMLPEDILLSEIILRLPQRHEREALYKLFSPSIIDKNNPAHGLMPKFIIDELNRDLTFINIFDGKKDDLVYLDEKKDTLLAILKIEGEKLYQLDLTRFPKNIHAELLELCPNLRLLVGVPFPIPKTTKPLNLITSLAFSAREINEPLQGSPLNLKYLNAISFKQAQADIEDVIFILKDQKTSLLTLDLTKSKIERNLERILNLSCTESLENLILKGVRLKPEDFTALAKVKDHLKSIDLTKTKIGGKLSTILKNLTHIETLILGKNRLTKEDLIAVSKLTSVKHLSLYHTRCAEHLDVLINSPLLKTVETLNLGRNKFLSLIDSVEKLNMPSLKNLTLNHNALKKKGALARFVVSPLRLKLKTLDISSNYLSSSAFEIFASALFPELEHLNISTNYKGLQNLKSAHLPKLKTCVVSDHEDLKETIELLRKEFPNVIFILK